MFYLKISESNMLRRSGSRGFHGQCPIRFFCTTSITTPYLILPLHTIMYTITTIPPHTIPHHNTMPYYIMPYQTKNNTTPYYAVYNQTLRFFCSGTVSIRPIQPVTSSLQQWHPHPRPLQNLHFLFDIQIKNILGALNIFTYLDAHTNAHAHSNT